MHERLTDSRDLAGPAPSALFGIGGCLFLLGGLVSGVSAPFYRAGLPAGQRGSDAAWIVAYTPIAATQALTLWVVVTLQRRAHRLLTELSHLAGTDPLTGLANRRTLFDTLGRETAAHLRRGSTLSLLMIDADQFKQLNDTAGHDAGDEALRRLAAVLSRASRRGDLAARFGGEEFTVIMTDCSLRDAVARADKLRAQIAAESADWRHALTVSIGVAELPRDMTESDAGTQLVHQADAALYAAKHEGRNRVEAYKG